MNRREQARATVLNAALDGSRTTKEAAIILGLSDRQGLRLKRAYREEGPGAPAHGNRDPRPRHPLTDAVGAAVARMAVAPPPPGK